MVSVEREMPQNKTTCTCVEFVQIIWTQFLIISRCLELVQNSPYTQLYWKSDKCFNTYRHYNNEIYKPFAYSKWH